MANIQVSRANVTRSNGTSTIDFGSSNKTTELIVTGIIETLSTSKGTVTMRLEATPELYNLFQFLLL